MDNAYLEKHLGAILSEAITEVVSKRPRDPITHIAQYLYKYCEAEKVREAERRRDRLRNEGLRLEREPWRRNLAHQQGSPYAVITVDAEAANPSDGSRDPNWAPYDPESSSSESRLLGFEERSKRWKRLRTASKASAMLMNAGRERSQTVAFSSQMEEDYGDESRGGRSVDPRLVTRAGQGMDRTAGTGQVADRTAGTSQGVDRTAGTDQGADRVVGTGQGADRAAATGQGTDRTAGTGQGADGAIQADRLARFNARNKGKDDKRKFPTM